MTYEPVDPDAPREPTGPRAGDVPPDDRWPASPRLVHVLGVGLVLLVLGAVSGRPDVMLLVAGPVVGGLVALGARPRGMLWADVERIDADDVPGTEAAGAPGGRPRAVLAARLHLAAPPGTDAARVRVSRPGHGAVEALVDVPLRRELDVTAASVRTGAQPLFRVEHQGVGGGAALTGPVGEAPADSVLVLPRGRTMPALPLPSRLRGLTGQHEARRPGDGGGLRDIHPLMPGESMRRVDWRVTARRSPGLEQLYVRRTLTLSEALVTLVVDSRDDVGPDPATWSGTRLIRPDDATSLDLARQAAVTVAEGYLAAGDRVGVEDLGVRRRALRAGAGRRHLDRVVHQLAVLRPEGEPRRRLRPPHVPAGSLVYLFSTFLDPEPAELAVVWRRAGHRVVAVDVLPRLREQGMDRRERLALRIVRVERQDRLADLVGAGVEVVEWADPGRATARLQVLSRRSHARGSA
ncbi:DUF58 domain-containing protein [Cellulomonas sp. APG4]|uniref:DUF58 domain-containing protein n=1 Tax=Cellulomonas sp. APG4 TaxID=1538656 RepID=UPI00351B8627